MNSKNEGRCQISLRIVRSYLVENPNLGPMSHGLCHMVYVTWSMSYGLCDTAYMLFSLSVT